jgi:hydroxyacylglutathione hydrolase
MNIDIIPCLKDNYSYVVSDNKTGNACVIDAPDSIPIKNFLKKKKLNLKYILNTHHHSDHVGGNLELKKEFKCKILGFRDDKNRIPGIDILLNDKQNFKFEETEIITEHTPGHTSGHIIFFFKKEKYLFTGDTLFSFGCGRLFEGSYLDMVNSLKKIKKLPIDTKIFFGHEYTSNNLIFSENLTQNNKALKANYEKFLKDLNKKKFSTPSTLEVENKFNIFLQFDNEKFKKEINLNHLNELDFFKKIRDLKDNA